MPSAHGCQPNGQRTRSGSGEVVAGTLCLRRAGTRRSGCLALGTGNLTPPGPGARLIERGYAGAIHPPIQRHLIHVTGGGSSMEVC